jgi:hypothetical protein
LASILGLVWPVHSIAQDMGGAEENAEVAVENTGAAVEVDGRPILVVYAHIGGFSPKERAAAIERRIVSVGKDRNIPIESIHSENRGTWTEILIGNDRIMGITDADAKGAERGRAELAAEYTEIVRQVVKQYRDDHAFSHLFQGTMYVLLTTVACLLLVVGLFWARKKLRQRLHARISSAVAGRPARFWESELGSILSGHWL